MAFLPRCVLAFALFTGAQGQLLNKITNTLIDDEKAATVSQLLAEGGGISVQTCGGPNDALSVERVDAQSDALALVVRGNLARQVRGGTVHATVRLIPPKGLSVSQRLKYIGATMVTRLRQFSEPLCQHLGLPVEGSNKSKDEGDCILQPGAHEMRFSFKKLPKMVYVGQYVLEVKALDSVGEPITCARGRFSVQAGKSSGLMRKLESGCPGLIMSNMHDIASLGVTDCNAHGDNMMHLDVYMAQHDLDYGLSGTWNEYCTTGSNVLTMYKYHMGLGKECSTDQDCDFGCPMVTCQGEGDDKRCNPSGETWCFAMETYDVSPAMVEGMCNPSGGMDDVGAAAMIRGVSGLLGSASLVALAMLSFLL